MVPRKNSLRNHAIRTMGVRKDFAYTDKEDQSVVRDLKISEETKNLH